MKEKQKLHEENEKMKERKREIDIKAIHGIKIGQTENVAAGTGCTVILAENGMAAGLDVRGGGPASRESELMNPLAAAQEIHGIVLAGGRRQCVWLGCGRRRHAVSGGERGRF